MDFSGLNNSMKSEYDNSHQGAQTISSVFETS